MGAYILKNQNIISKIKRSTPFHLVLCFIMKLNTLYREIRGLEEMLIKYHLDGVN